MLTMIFPSFLAGLLIFLAPCTLPLVPAYLGFISGVSFDEIRNSQNLQQIRKKMMMSGILFVTGFSVVYIALGLLAGYVGFALNDYRVWTMRVGGALVIVFGLHMLGILRVRALDSDRHLKLPRFMGQSRLLAAFLIGVIFAFGWSPCIGPVLATILFFASSTGTALEGGVLLAVFSLGFSIPFLIVAYSAGTLFKYFRSVTKYLDLITKIGGVFLVFLGILLLTNNFSLLVEWGYRLFHFAGYERLLNYL